MDKLKAIETFVAVAAHGSLTAAARIEDVATAIVSRRLDALEAHLGVKLLVRTTRRVSLTHEGVAFLEDCQRVLAELADAEANVAAGSVKATGHLRITAPAGFGRRHVAPLVPAFRALHRDIRITLNLSDRLVDLAGEGYDCAVRVGDLPDSSLVSMRIGDNRRLCVASPAYVERFGAPQTPQELLQHDCLVLASEASQTRGWAFQMPADLGNRVIYIKPRGALDCTDGQVLHDWCLAGHGIAWRSTWEVEADIAQGRLVHLLSGYDAPPNGIYVVFPQRRHMPLRARLWIEFLREQYANPAFWRRSRPEG